MKVSEMCMLDILERERHGLNKMKLFGDSLTNERLKEKPDESYCESLIKKRDEGIAELNEARRDLQMYCRHWGIKYNGGGEF